MRIDDQLEVWLANLPTSGHVRLAVGAVADREGRITRIVARQLFWDALGRVSRDHYEEALAHQRIVEAVSSARFDQVRDDLVGNLTHRWGLGLDLVKDLFVNAIMTEHCVNSGKAVDQRIMVSEFELGLAMYAIYPYPRIFLDSMDPKALTSTPTPVYLDLEDDLTHETTLDWGPLVEARGAAETRLAVVLKGKLKQALDETEQDFMRAGASQPREKRRVEHFDWLVRYQILEESFSNIARKPKLSTENAVDRKTVRSAVNSTADLIGMTLRASTIGGRPSGT